MSTVQVRRGNYDLVLSLGVRLSQQLVWLKTSDWKYWTYCLSFKFSNPRIVIWRISFEPSGLTEVMSLVTILSPSLTSVLILMQWCIPEHCQHILHTDVRIFLILLLIRNVTKYSPCFSYSTLPKSLTKVGWSSIRCNHKDQLSCIDYKTGVIWRPEGLEFLTQSFVNIDHIFMTDDI